MRRVFTVFVAVALAVGTLVVQAAAPAGAVTPNADVVAIEAGLTQFATFTHGLNETGKFGDVVPLLSVTPGEDAALGFNDLLDKAIVNRFPANAVTLADLAGLSTAGTDLEANGRHLVLTATPTPAPGGSTTEQLKIDFTVTRTVDAGLQIDSSSPAVRLAATQGVETKFTATGSFTAAFDTAKNFFYIARSNTTPSLAVDVSASIPDLTKVDISLGILAMKLAGSTFQLGARFATTWKDSNNDGKLAFSEPASGNSTTPGELAQAANTAAIVSADYATSPSSTVNGDLDLDTKPSTIPGLTLPSIPTSFSVSSSDLSTGVPTVSTGTLDSRLVKFATLNAKDLATGLARLMLLVRAAQLANITGTGHGNPQLPFINAQLADAIRPDELFAAFLSDQNNIDQTTGVPQFASIQGFFDALSAATVKVQGTDVVSAAISNASYDDSTSKLAFQIDVTRNGGTQNLIDIAGSNDPSLGAMDVADGTRSVTGIRNAVSPTGANGASTMPTYTMHLPVVLDLRTPITGAACATANDPSNPSNSNCPYQLQTKNGNQVISTQVISSLPVTSERFLLRTGGTLLDADTTVAASIHNGSPVVGMAGFVQAGFDTGNVSITKGAGAHMVHIGLKSQGDLRFSAFLSQLQSNTPGNAIAYDTSAQATASLHGFVPGSPNFFSGLTPNLTASSTDITLPSNLQIVGPDFTTRLKPLDFGSDPDALRGAAANALGALKDALNQLDALSGSGATHERLTAKVQLLGRSLGSLVHANELDTFLQNISNNANGPNTGAPDSLQELITRANTALGANTIGFHMDGGNPAQHLVLDVDYKRTIANDGANLGMRFQSGAKTLDLVGVDPDGALNPSGSTQTQVSLAVPLDGSAPSSPSDAQVARTGSIAISPDVSFDGTRTAMVGALPVALGTNGNHAKINVQPRLTVNGPGGAGFVSLANWLAGATSNAPGAGNATCPDNSTGKGVCADLPALADGFKVSLSGDDIFYADGLSAITPDFTSTTPPSNFGAAQGAVSFDLNKITDGFDSGLGPFLDQMAAAIQAASGDGKLPFVGKDIAQGSDFVEKLKTDLLSKLDGLNASGPTINDVQNALTALNVNGLIGGVTVGLDCGGLCNPSHNADEIQGVTLSFKVGQGSTTPGQKCTGNNCPTLSPGAIDLGIPGVRLQSSASPEFALGWSLDFKVGFDKDHGFYVDASAPGNNALKLALAAFLPDFSGNVGFVTIDATDSNGPSSSTDTQHDHAEFQGLFDIHVNQLNGNSKLSLSDISSAPITQLLGISLTGGADVDYKLKAGVSSDIPGLSAEFLLNWHWNSDSPAAKTDLVLGFRDVSLELKPLFDGLLSPVYKTFQKVVAPFKPIVDAIQAPLPGVSDVSRLVGGGDISILTLMKLYGTFSQDGGEQTQALERIIRLLSTLVQLAGDGTVKLGDFGIVPDKALAGVPTPDQIQNFITGNLLNGVNDVIDKIHEKCAECADAINQLEQQVGLNELTDKSIGLHFPVLDNPGSLANLLLGADVPLVTYDTGPLHNHFDFAVTIGPLGLPIFIDIGVAATIDARFKAGFDTYGMRKALQGGGVASILDGLYLQDFDDQGHEKPEITIKDAMTYIDAKVSVVAAEAGIRGDITLSANLDLRDTDSPEQPNVPNTGTGDGKVRFSEIARDAQGNFNPFCLFNAKGDISARLVLFFRIKFIVEEEWDDVLAQSKILDIDYDCSQPRKDPVLAHESGSDLIIHVGKNGTDALRGDSYWGNEPGGDVTKPPFPPVPGGETQPTEITTVRALHDKDGNFRGFGVDLLGYHKDFLNPSLTRVVIDATDYDGEEVVNLMGDGSGTAKNATSRVDHFDKQAVFYGGKHNDQFKADSVAGQQIAADGGPGNDLVVTGYGNDLVAGGGGQDNISTAGGNDKVEGDGKIFGGLAPTMDPTGLFANTPDPNDGNDNIDAGIGADTVNGGGGDDFIAGGVDDGRAPTDPNNAALRDDNNVLIGGCGNDHINGGPHHDEIYGEAFSNALANGTATGDIAGCTAEADHIDSGTGNDLIFGGGGADDIRAHSTPDDNSSNPKADVVYGNGGNDNITTGSGDDTISGGPDIDNIFGGTGADLIHGDAGNDNLRGDTLSSGKKLLRSTVKLPSTVIDGNDEMYGDAGNDTMFGGGGNDLMFGDSGNSKCPAPTSTNPTVWPAPTEVSIATDGEDDIGGGPGDDIISGEGAKDTITGDTGNDRVCGHAGDDTVSGNGGTDLLSGGSGGDTMYGDENNDHVEGNNGVDTMSGGPGIDQLIGGTSVAASNDNGDTIYGDADADTIIGDNGTISDSTPPVVNVFDLTSGNSAYGGGDTIDGGYGNDLAFGGLDGDTVRGGNDDDHLEGNVGLDNVYGGPDQDDILGGTSPVALGGADPTSIPDVGDNIFGEGGSDVALGDNGVIARDNPPVLDGSDPSDVPMVHRVVTMLGVYTGGPIVGGNDNMNGGDNDDWMFGQAGNDTLNGDANSDHLEGNNATDTVNGGDGDDDIFGGTSPMALAAGKTTTDVSDNGDTLNGDAGADYMLGDNGNLVHPLDSGKWARAQADNSFLRTSTLLDRLTIGGGDTMSGGADNDRMWGEVGNDTMSGNGGDDYMEGNIASDVMAGGSNDDDIIGGTSPVALPAGADAAVEDDGVVSAGKRTGNHICGFECGQTTSNGDNDVIAGNNARVDRCAPLAGAVPRGRDNCAWTQTSYGNAEPGSPSLGTAATRYVTLLGESSTETNRDADDYVEGNSGNDDAYGQDGNDVEHGDTPAATSPRVVSGWASVTAPSPDECLPVSDATAGQDRLLGGYGNDLGCGDGGNDALLGDRATVGLVPFSGALRTIDSAGPPNMTSTFPNSGHTIYPVTLIDPTVGGNDLLFGGPDNDSMHGGAGDDFMQGDDGIRIGGQVAATGSDILFGDNGNDSMEGGPGNDDSWGGYGNDDIDVWRDTSGSAPKVNEDNKSLDYLFMNIPAYAARFPAPAGKSYDKDVGVTNDPTTANGDHGYGGFNRDILQADTLNDRLDDSFGSYNLFFVCPAAYGGSQITRALSPGIVTYFQDLGEAEGATGAATPSSSGGGEVSIVYPGTANPDNAGAAYKTTPGHFTCIP